LDAIGATPEQTHKLLTAERGASVEGTPTKMMTTTLAAWINNSFKPNMSKEETTEAIDKIVYETQNMAGSPNFAQTHNILRVLSAYFQFFSASFKGEATDYRRLVNMFSNRGEGVRINTREKTQMILNFSAVTSAIVYYAIANIMDDDDEEEFNTQSAFYRDNYINIPAGTFDFENKDGEIIEHTDFIRIPLRGLTSTINVTAIHFLKWLKREDPEDLKKMGYNVLGNTSPLKLHGDSGREYTESIVSNMTPFLKFGIEEAFNRDTHHHIELIPDSFGENSMLQRYENMRDMEPDEREVKGALPYQIFKRNTAEWAKELSQMLYEEAGIEITPITLEHLETSMGRPSKLIDKATTDPFRRSESEYPVYEPKKKKDGVQ
jgi:hypothetical protein